MDQPPSNPLIAHLDQYSQRLKGDFERLRETHRDPDVKGGKNEKTVADFMTLHTRAAQVVTNAEIIDSTGRTSGEMDVVMCNHDQPFVGENPELLIVEGVDACIQVKASITDTELDRIVKNCVSLKSLIRKHSAGDHTFGMPESQPFNLDRVPYFVFAFTSALCPEEIALRLATKLNGVPPTDQPDAILWLGRCLIVNCRKAMPLGLANQEGPLDGIGVFECGDAALREFLRCVHELPARVQRFRSPLCHYFLPTMRLTSIVQCKDLAGDGRAI